MVFQDDRHKVFLTIDNMADEVMSTGQPVLYDEIVYKLTRKFKFCSEKMIKERIKLNVKLKQGLNFDGEAVTYER